MSAKTYLVREVARLSGVTVRTLHHYDSIGLLVPSGRTKAGYRLYTEDDLLKLQQILLWRELGFPLPEIRRVLDDPTFDRALALRRQRDELVRRGERTKAMIRSVDAALESLEGGKKTMDAKKLFDGFDPALYEDEAKERWGDTEAYRESMRRTKGYTEKDWKRIKEEGQVLFQKLAEKMKQGAEPRDPEVVSLAEEHRRHIERWFYPLSREAHRGLGEMFVTDERFTANIDKLGEGLAQFLAEAIRANAERG